MAIILFSLDTTIYFFLMLLFPDQCDKIRINHAIRDFVKIDWFDLILWMLILNEVYMLFCKSCENTASMVSTDIFLSNTLFTELQIFWNISTFPRNISLSHGLHYRIKWHNTDDNREHQIKEMNLTMSQLNHFFLRQDAVVARCQKGTTRS